MINNENNISNRRPQRCLPKSMFSLLEDKLCCRRGRQAGIPVYHTSGEKSGRCVPSLERRGLDFVMKGQRGNEAYPAVNALNKSLNINPLASPGAPRHESTQALLANSYRSTSQSLRNKRRGVDGIRRGVFKGVPIHQSC